MATTQLKPDAALHEILQCLQDLRRCLKNPDPISKTVANPDSFVAKMTNPVPICSPLLPKPPDPPDFEISAPFLSNATSKTSKNKVPRKYSCAKVYEKMENGLCLFCEEPDIAGHHLKHKNPRIFMFECDDDQLCAENELVEPVVAKDSSLHHPLECVPDLQVFVADVDDERDADTDEVVVSLENNNELSNCVELFPFPMIFPPDSPAVEIELSVGNEMVAADAIEDEDSRLEKESRRGGSYVPLGSVFLTEKSKENSSDYFELSLIKSPKVVELSFPQYPRSSRSVWEPGGISASNRDIKFLRRVHKISFQGIPQEFSHAEIGIPIEWVQSYSLINLTSGSHKLLIIHEYLERHKCEKDYMLMPHENLEVLEQVSSGSLSLLDFSASIMVDTCVRSKFYGEMQSMNQSHGMKGSKREVQDLQCEHRRGILRFKPPSYSVMRVDAYKEQWVNHEQGLSSLRSLLVIAYSSLPRVRAGGAAGGSKASFPHLSSQSCSEAKLLRVQSLLQVQILEKPKKFHKTWKFKYKPDFLLRVFLQAEQEQNCDCGDVQQLLSGNMKSHMKHKWRSKQLQAGPELVLKHSLTDFGYDGNGFCNDTPRKLLIPIKLLAQVIDMLQSRCLEWLNELTTATDALLRICYMNLVRDHDKFISVWQHLVHFLPPADITKARCKENLWKGAGAVFTSMFAQYMVKVHFKSQTQVQEHLLREVQNTLLIYIKRDLLLVQHKHKLRKYYKSRMFKYRDKRQESDKIETQQQTLKSEVGQSRDYKEEQNPEIDSMVLIILYHFLKLQKVRSCINLSFVDSWMDSLSQHGTKLLDAGQKMQSTLVYSKEKKGLKEMAVGFCYGSLSRLDFTVDATAGILMVEFHSVCKLLLGAFVLNLLAQQSCVCGDVAQSFLDHGAPCDISKDRDLMILTELLHGADPGFATTFEIIPMQPLPAYFPYPSEERASVFFKTHELTIVKKLIPSYNKALTKVFVDWKLHPPDHVLGSSTMTS